MKRSISYIFSFFLILGIQTIVIGQADTVLVPVVFESDPNGALSRFIEADTMPNGERTNLDRYYELERGKIYFMSGAMLPDFPFRLIAKESDASNKPPVVATATSSDGKAVPILFMCSDDVYIKNIAFQMAPPSGLGESEVCFRLDKEGGNYIFDGVIWEWGSLMMARTSKPVNKIEVRNSYFRNNEHRTHIWNGRGIGFFLENPADTVIMTNNTFFNMTSFAFVADGGSIPPKSFLFDHNTLVNEIKYPLHCYWQTNAVVTNNLFFNSSSYSETAKDRKGQDPDEQMYGIVNISKVPGNILSARGMTEEERIYKVGNNAHFYTQDIKDYWGRWDLTEVPWMNERTMNMFADDSKYPNLESGVVYSSNPGIINPGEAKMVKWMETLRNKQGNTYWGWDPDGVRFELQWPFPEDLSYTNMEIKSGADDNYPVGDLNWWPGLLEKWNNGLVLEVESEGLNIFNEVVLSPNPCIDNFIIKYSLDAVSSVQIDIHDMAGRKLVKILEGKQTSGNHEVKATFDLANGIYVLKMMSGTSILTKKFIVLK